MLASFSVSWYWSIAKMLRTKVAAGKSVNFVLMICFGYTLGISSKLVAWQETGELSSLIWVYTWNLLVTSFDAMLVVRYSRSATVEARVVPFLPSTLLSPPKARERIDPIA